MMIAGGERVFILVCLDAVGVAYEITAVDAHQARLILAAVLAREEPDVTEADWQKEVANDQLWGCIDRDDIVRVPPGGMP